MDNEQNPELNLDLNPAAVETWPPSPVTPEPKHGLFVGRFGLRAGWGILIFLVLYALFTVVGGILAAAATGHLHEMIAAHQQAKAHPGSPKHVVTLPFSPKLVIVVDSVLFFGLLGGCALLAKIERRKLAAYGIGAARRSDLLLGAFWGLVAMCGLVAVLHALHVLVFDGRVLFGWQVPFWGAKWLLAFLFVGLAEEYSFRGYLQYTLMRGVWGLAEKLSPVRTRAVAFWMAATILSGLFTFAHTGNAGETRIGLLQVFLAGVTLAYGLWRTGSLWWSIGMHMTWDWTQSFLFGVADSGNVSIGRLFVTHPAGNPILSGGPDGPEGSIIGVGALLFLCLMIRFTTRPGMQPAIEQEPEAPHQPVHIPVIV